MTYSPELVERLLPAAWDRTWAWGMQNPSAPDPDMPTAKYTSPKEATTFWCHLIDIRRAWEGAPLKPDERRALLLHFGFEWTQQEIGDHEQVSKKTINKRVKAGLRVLSDYLNV